VVLIAVLVVVAGGAGIAAGSADPGSDATISPDVATAEGEQTVLVHFESPLSTAESGDVSVDQLKQRASLAQAPLEQYASATPGVTVVNSFWLGNIAVVEIDHDRADVQDIAAIDGVERITPNFEVTLDTGGVSAQSAPTATDSAATLDPVAAGPGYPDLAQTAGTMSSHFTYGLDQINAPEVWNNYGTKGSGATVVVLDTGIDPDHPDIDLANWAEWDGNGNQINTDPQDYGEHGTHVSGTVSGGDASGTYIGVAPNVELWHGAVLTNCGQDGCGGTFANITAGMQWAVNNNADVISMSLGPDGGGYIDAFIDPVRNARSSGTLVVASIGNSGQGTSGSPGNVFETLGVGATDSNENVPSFSAGETIDTSADWKSPPSEWPATYVVPTVSAPGASVDSSVPGGGYTAKSGTSMAAPHVSGAAALVQAATSSDLTPADIEQALIDTANNPNGDQQDDRYGHGIIDVKAAVDSLTGSQPANFEVTIDSTNSPVSEGDTLTVDATIANTGDDSATQTVTLDVPGLGQTSTSVALSGGQSTTETFSVSTGSGDAGDYTATVESQDDSDSRAITVQGPANFDVTLTTTNSPVSEGGGLAVDAEIENTGGESGTQTITLDVGPLGTDSTDVTLNSGESTTETLSVATGSGDAGDYTATVTSEDDSDSQNVIVNEPANFSVTIDGTNSPVTASEALTVDVQIENTGDVSGTQTITLDVPSVGQNSTDVTLDGGNSTTETLSLQTGSGDAGSYTATVESEDDTASTDVTILEPANFTVSVTGTNSPVGEEETLSVDVQIENTGDVSGTQTIEMTAGALGGNSTDVTLDGGESTTQTLSLQTGSGDAGSYTATVTSDDSSDSTSVTVTEGPSFEVTITETNSPVGEGDPLSVVAQVENTGEESGTQTVTLDVGALGQDSTDVALAGGDSTTETFSVSTGSGDAGDYTASVASEDDSDSARVAVAQPAAFDVEIVDTNSPILDGETLSVGVRVENTGGLEGTQPVELSVGGTVQGTSELTLAGGESGVTTLAWVTDDGDSGAHTITVASEDDQFQTAVKVASEESDLGPPPVAGDDAPKDLDGDGVHRDLNGDGAFSLADIQLFFEHRNELVVQDHVDFFDFDGDGEITLADVQVLYQAYRAEN
jgi:hypothetical protein